MAFRVLLSKYHSLANARNSLIRGDKAVFHARNGDVYTVVIDSDPVTHPLAPGDQLGYECIDDKNERFFAYADQLEIIRPDDYVAADWPDFTDRSVVIP